MIINNNPLYIGTAGYNYDDWKGTAFAPEDTLNYDLLTYYNKTKLNFLELTYTFYKFPIAEKMLGISERLRDDISLSVRLTKSLMRKTLIDEEVETFREGIKPLIDNGRLSALIADFHPQFSASRENFNILCNLKNAFPEVPVFFELFNSTWHKERFYDEFRESNIGIVGIDAPNIQGMAPFYPICSNNYLYLRLYGKNKSWLSINNKILDYSYSDVQLKRFAKEINEKSLFAKKTFVSFCNVTNAYAPENALRLIDLI